MGTAGREAGRQVRRNGPVMCEFAEPPVIAPGGGVEDRSRNSTDIAIYKRELLVDLNGKIKTYASTDFIDRHEIDGSSVCQKLVVAALKNDRVAVAHNWQIEKVGPVTVKVKVVIQNGVRPTASRKAPATLLTLDGVVNVPSREMITLNGCPLPGVPEPGDPLHSAPGV